MTDEAYDTTTTTTTAAAESSAAAGNATATAEAAGGQPPAALEQHIAAVSKRLDGGGRLPRKAGGELTVLCMSPYAVRPWWFPQPPLFANGGSAPVKVFTMCMAGRAGGPEEVGGA